MNNKSVTKSFLIFLLTLVPIIASAFSPNDSLSESANVYVISCEPGEVIYEKFGHSAIRIIDPVKNIDLIFHWGLYSFDEPNFVANFVKGNLLYEMGVCDSKYFFKGYIERDSYIYSTKINYTYDEKIMLWEKLWENYKPENRKYCYNFIYDNCATRVYDNIMNVVTEHYSSMYNEQRLSKTTYRTIINEYLDNSPWYKLGINLIISSEADSKITPIQIRTFPFYTKSLLESINITRDGETMPLATQDENVNTSKKNPEKHHSSIPVILLPILLVIMECVYFAFKKHYMPYLTQITLIFSGLLGLIIFYLSVFSIHPIVQYNYNILWCSPLNLLLGIILFLKKRYTLKIISTIIMFCSALSTIIILMVELQTMTTALFCWYICILIIFIITIQTYSFALKNIYRKLKK